MKGPATSIDELTEDELDRARLASQFVVGLLASQRSGAWTRDAIIDNAFRLADEFRQEALKRRIGV